MGLPSVTRDLDLLNHTGVDANQAGLSDGDSSKAGNLVLITPS